MLRIFPVALLAALLGAGSVSAQSPAVDADTDTVRGEAELATCARRLAGAAHAGRDHGRLQPIQEQPAESGG